MDGRRGGREKERETNRGPPLPTSCKKLLQREEKQPPRGRRRFLPPFIRPSFFFHFFYFTHSFIHLFQSIIKPTLLYLHLEC